MHKTFNRRDLLKLAGAINVAAGFKGYKPLNDEAIVEARPDLILMMQQGGPSMASDAEILANPAIALTPAGKNKALIRMNSQSQSSPPPTGRSRPIRRSRGSGRSCVGLGVVVVAIVRPSRGPTSA